MNTERLWHDAKWWVPLETEVQRNHYREALEKIAGGSFGTAECALIEAETIAKNALKG